MKHSVVRLMELMGLIVTTAVAAWACTSLLFGRPAPRIAGFAIPWIVCLLVINSVVTYAVFRLDKYLARREAWRIKEMSLHWMELMGGWPGVWIGMHLWSKNLSDRHKYNKKEYWLVTLLATFADLGIWAFVLR